MVVRGVDATVEWNGREHTQRAAQRPAGASMIKPAILRPGDLIGVVAPAGATEAAAVAAGVQVLERFGFRVRLGDSVFKRMGFLAGNDAERAADLAAMFEDPEVRAIIAARGGYGSGRLLPHFDLGVARCNPKIFVGYSDLTFLLTQLVQQAELVVFHGPMVSGLGHSVDSGAGLLGLLSGDRAGWNLSAREVVQPGTAEGMLVGGCLSVLVATLGTPYEIETAGRLLFLEDVNEKPYRIDRMLTQLRHAGKLSTVAGVIFGEMPGCTADPNEAVTVRDVIDQAFASAHYPVAYGLPSGHGRAAGTLPLGVRARLAGDRVTLLEAPLLEASPAVADQITANG
jgi:muramoyltetrapeptide carboxypeptidase